MCILLSFQSRLRLTRRAAPERGAFTLIELVIVLAIIGVISALAIPRYGQSVARYNADGGARRIAADFELLRRSAMTRSIARRIEMRSGADPGYNLVGLTHMDRASQPFVVSFAADCFGVERVSYNFGGDTELVFDMYGVPDSAGEVVIRAGAHERTIRVDAQTGRTSISE